MPPTIIEVISIGIVMLVMMSANRAKSQTYTKEHTKKRVNNELIVIMWEWMMNITDAVFEIQKLKKEREDLARQLAEARKEIARLREIATELVGSNWYFYCSQAYFSEDFKEYKELKVLAKQYLEGSGVEYGVLWKEEMEGEYYHAAQVERLVEAAKEVADAVFPSPMYAKLKAALAPFVEEK